MTLILTCISETFVLQVSDRRLSLPNGSVYDDEANKALQYGVLCMAYTGLGELLRMPTDIWATEALRSAANVPDGLRRLAEQATGDMQRYAKVRRIRKRDRLLAFVGAGWMVSPRGLAPFAFWIANCVGRRGMWLTSPRAEFRFTAAALPERKTAEVFVAGQLLGRTPAGHEAKRNALRGEVGRRLSRGEGPEQVADVLAAAIREVAVSNERVGASVMISCVPAQAVTGDSYAVHGGRPNTETATFAYRGEGNDRFDAYSPHIVFPSISRGGTPAAVAFRNLRFEESPEGWSVSGELITPESPAPRALTDAELRREPRRRFPTQAGEVAFTPQTLTDFLQMSPAVEHWATVIESIGLQVGPVRRIDQTVTMARRVGITTVSQVELMFRLIEPWGEKFLRLLHTYKQAEGLDRGGYVDRNGILAMFLTAVFPEILAVQDDSLSYAYRRAARDAAA